MDDLLARASSLFFFKLTRWNKGERLQGAHRSNEKLQEERTKKREGGHVMKYPREGSLYVHTRVYVFVSRHVLAIPCQRSKHGVRKNTRKQVRRVEQRGSGG